jgi:hypothetical protein
LCTRQRTSGFHTMQGISWLSEEPIGLQEGSAAWLVWPRGSL